MHDAKRMAPSPLIGRDAELSHLSDLVGNASARGGALMIRGEPGVGKSALLAAAVSRARQSGMIVQSTSGTEPESRLAFAGLHRLVQPFLGHLGGLPLPQRRALQMAFGLADGQAPDTFMVGMAVLGLIADAAGDIPVLLAVDDAHWLDGATCEVLAFVGRRLEHESALLLFTVREPAPPGFGALGVAEMHLGGLRLPDARALVSKAAPGLPADLQSRILREAAGNPLALLELPKAAAGFKDRPGVKPLPLTARLEAAFVGRLADLKEDARVLLLLRALEEAPVEICSQAAESLLGRPVDPAAVQSAIAAGLGHVAGGRFDFRHPLVRSAVQQGATVDDRRRAHLALARVLARDVDRSVWHEAAAAIAPDEGVASRLERTAERAVLRGGVDVAIAALEQAAVLSGDKVGQGRRLIRAAELSIDVDHGQSALRLLGEAFALDLPAQERVRVAFLLEVLRSTGWSGSEGMQAYIRAMRDLVESGDADAAANALASVALRAHWTNLDNSTRAQFVASAGHLTHLHDDPRILNTLALADPAGTGGRVIARLRLRTPVGEASTEALFQLGIAAAATWSANLALPFLHAAVERFRAQGRPGMVGQVLTFVAWDEMRMGNMAAALAAADEAGRLCADTGQKLYTASAFAVEAIARAERKADADAGQRLSEAEGIFLAAGAFPMISLVQLARGRLALAAERYGEAYLRLIRIFDPGDSGYHQFAGGWVLADLAEAAIAGDGELARVAQVVTGWRRVAEATGATHLRVQLAYADAVLAPEDEAGDRFEELITCSSAGWPYYRARGQLAYGGWLRRHRRAAESRQPLREAAETFDALGAAVLAERARRELRASGQAVPRRARESWDQLSPQELQIAQMAAAGLSNRDIGERLYLSHRTVGTHLYRLFPKLGVTSRAELGMALRETGSLTSSDLRAAMRQLRSVGLIGRHPDRRSQDGRRRRPDHPPGLGSRAGSAGQLHEQDAGGFRPRPVAAPQ